MKRLDFKTKPLPERSLGKSDERRLLFYGILLLSEAGAIIRVTLTPRHLSFCLSGMVGISEKILSGVFLLQEEAHCLLYGLDGVSKLGLFSLSRRLNYQPVSASCSPAKSGQEVLCRTAVIKTKEMSVDQNISKLPCSSCVFLDV